MNKTIIELLFIVFPFVFNAQELSVELVNQKEFFSPGKVHSLVFKISNPYPYQVMATLKTKLPEQWLLASAHSDIDLTANETKIHIIPVNIPSFSAKGEHNFHLTINNKTNNQITNHSFFLNVNHVRKITISSLSSSNYVKAGNTISSLFIIKNEGNDMEEVMLKASKGAVIKGSAIVHIPAGKSEEVNVYQHTNVQQSHLSQNLIKLTAVTKNDSLQDVYAYYRTDVIPAFQANEDVYLRFPVKISTTYIARERNKDFQDAFQGEIYGKGSFNEQHTKQLEFRAVGPDRFGLTAFSQYEEYFINYTSNNFFVHLGDKVYSSSFLTEFARYGRGFELRKNINKLEIGGFYNNPRFFKDIKEEINVYAKINFDLKNNIRYGYLVKHMQNLKESHLQYLSGEATVFKSVTLQAEYSVSNIDSSKGSGWQLQGQANLKKLNASASYINTKPNFTGYFTNTRFFTSHINYRFSPKFSAHVNYQKDARNFERDTLYSAAPYRERLQLGLSYRYMRKGTVSIYNGIQKYEDRMEPKQFFYKEKFSRLELNHEIGFFGINFQSYFAETTNFLTNTTGNSSIYTTDFSYNIKGTSINLYTSYAQLNRYQTANQNLFLYGGRVNSFISSKINVSAFYQNTYYIEDYYADRNLFELSLNYKISPKQEINVISRYALSQQQIQNKDFALSVKYTLNLNIPVKKIKEYGSLQGNITNLGNTNTAGIKLHLGHQTAITDARGNFSFKNIIPDTYFLEIAPENLSFNDITDISIPAKISVTEGENYFNFGITQSASIKGQIILEYDNQGTDKENIIVEITSENDIYRKICDIKKPFDFTYLRPGNWQLKIYRNGLSKHWNIKADVFNFILEPGEEKEVTVEIIKHKREIKYLQKPMKVRYNTLKK
ncbi:hypothetical protein [Paenimyroides baculatum]|uniref:Carboxypeptidase regulatory-like domain-containing protein n=1 Tax=Paenimyroides baculatum TaxID=2608000 RepID=A0A5M6CF26_9FLAO|nr:hypothetical protein [Paenimyroides baculatum]KAA5531709.1 hypothetical protein F0460_15380 [Paenimyroides baculatum]